MPLTLQRLTHFDECALRLVQRWRRPLMNRFFLLFTYSGKGQVWFAFSLLLTLLTRHGIQIVPAQASFLREMLSPLLAWIAGWGLKRFFARRRPSTHISGFQPAITPPTCGSFPSSHAASASAFAFALLYVHHPLAPWVGLWATLVSFSRIYLGVHYVSDVLGGLALGLASCAVMTIWGLGASLL